MRDKNQHFLRKLNTQSLILFRHSPQLWLFHYHRNPYMLVRKLVLCNKTEWDAKKSKSLHSQK